MSWVCPECHARVEDELHAIMLFSKSSFPNSTKKRCCSLQCLALAQQQNREVARKYCEKNNLEQLTEKEIEKKENPNDEDTAAEIEAKKTPKERLFDEISDRFGGQISPAQWSAISKQRTELLKKYSDLSDNKIRAIIHYAYDIKKYKKEPTLLFVYLYYEEAKAYYEQEAQKVLKVEKSFEENQIENKLKIHYTQKQRKNKMIDFSTLNMEGGEKS